MAEYEHFDLELEPGDCVMTYTDALIESSDADGEQLGEDGVLRLLRLLGNAEPEKLIAELLGEIAERYPKICPPTTSPCCSCARTAARSL